MHIYITNALIQYNLISDNEREVYEYGIEVFLLKIMHFFTIFVISIILNYEIESLIFLITYYNVRGIIGGYHSKSRLVCLTETILIMSLLYLFIMSDIIQNNILIVLAFMFFTSIVIYIKNKTVSFSNKLLLMLLCILITGLIFCFLNLKTLLISLAYSLVLSLLLHLIKR
ncbi:accessory gene regulator B family protein [Thomasclavelia sp.]